MVFKNDRQRKKVMATLNQNTVPNVKVSMPEKDYVVSNGTYYNKNTPQRVINIIDRHMNKYDSRLQFQWGDTKTGRDWGDVNDITGYIGRSTGSIKIPLLIPKKTSTGGGAIMTDAIVLIKYANKKDGGILYKHPKYHK